MRGSTSHRTASDSSALGFGVSGSVEGVVQTKLKKESCSGYSTTELRQACMRRNFDNGFGFVMGGYNKKRKTKMQKKRKNRGTKRSKR
jgi:hypothetical protein